MTRLSCAAAAALFMGSVSFAGPAGAQEPASSGSARSISDLCNETAQRRFDRAMRYQHSFWYRQSREIFEEVAKADPECAIAWWGVALSLLNNPFNPPPAANLRDGLAAIQKAKRPAPKPSARTRLHRCARGLLH